MMNNHPLAIITPRELRTAMGMFATGVTVVTTGDGEDMHAMTANAITSVSLDPPLLLFCVNKDATMAALIRRNQGFAVNILDESQMALSGHFAGMAAGKRLPQFSFRDWIGGPRLEGSATSLGCGLHALYDGGDHWIAVGRVLAIHQPESGANPLLFYRGRYHRLAQPVTV